MNSAYVKDIGRTIVKTKKRFISIMMITMLGMTMLTGLKAGCVDLRKSADHFYDEQNLYDIHIVSTLGLNQQDIEALQTVEGVRQIEGSYEETASFYQDGKAQPIAIQALSKQGMNTPYVLEGSLPIKSNEIAVSESYLHATGKQLKDSITIEVNENSTLKQKKFIISAVVLDARNVAVEEGLVSFRSTSTVNDTFFLNASAFQNTVYTSINITLQDTKELMCYDEEYGQHVNKVIAAIEQQVKPAREQARYDELVSKMKLQSQKANASLAKGTSNQKVNTLTKPVWYVQDRSALSSYTSVESDASSIETVGNAFPIIFLIVAILISLTTITRMVEEERGLIGTYKALGFSDGAIYLKYLLYAFFACLLGGFLGDIAGFIFLPKFLFTVFQVLYQFPEYELSFHALYGIGGILLFIFGIVFAAVIACRVELSQMPAVLMRPKAPKAGSRVWLESIKPLWRRLSFLNKVTMRNLFRFKKRMFMTIGGIAGCTALILCGFAIKDSVSELLPNQYDHIYRYDFMGVVSEDSHQKKAQALQQDPQIADIISVRIDSLKVKADQDGQEESVQLMVIPNGASLKSYIGLEDVEGAPLELKDGIYITQNASQIVGFDQGDTIYIQDQDLVQQEVEVTEIVQNYLGNTIYMTQHTYETLCKPYKANGFLAHMSDKCEDPIHFADEFSKEEQVISAVSVSYLKTQFAEAFSLINTIVYLITIMAAGLAFVVLFTLSTTNISERERELATIKVLGFFDSEVHVYVHKETLLLTMLGILCGLPLGRMLSGMLTAALHMPSIHFAVSVYPISYGYAALLSLSFALIVNLLINRTLNRIHMVEALKSIE